jgi:hypothetical protein
MAPPSTSQLALLIICGTLLATFSCFYALDTRSTVGGLGIAVGAVLFAYAGIKLIVAGRARWTFHEPDGDTVPLAPEPSVPSGPTAGQGCLLALSGMLLFFFTCSGAFVDLNSFGGLALLAIAGTLTGTVFMTWGLIRFVRAVWRALRPVGK